MTATTKKCLRITVSGDAALVAYATSALPNFDILSAASIGYDGTKDVIEYIIF
jgi:hypothetical protein